MKQLTLPFSVSKTNVYPKTQLDAILYFMARLDIEMVDALLDENKTYQDFPKYLFVSKLQDAFDVFIDAGDKLLAVHKGCCVGCTKGCSGVTFLGAKGHYLDVLFVMEESVIKDIYGCSSFENEQGGLQKLIQVFIEPIPDVF